MVTWHPIGDGEWVGADGGLEKVTVLELPS
jgi:hypothetical protein